jgi:hypothetical protein
MMVELKPCPFCGAVGDYLDADIINVSCLSCNAEGPPRQQGRGGVMTAEEQWNTRAILSTGDDAGPVERAASSVEELDYIAYHENTALVVGQAALRAKDAILSLTARNKALKEALANERGAILKLLDDSVERWRPLGGDERYIEGYEIGVADACAFLAEDIRKGPPYPTNHRQKEGGE